MEMLQVIATFIGVIGLILFVLLLVLHYFGPKTASWIRSNREEKIGFSKNCIYNANGYPVQSGSELLLNSTGSFKRFESIDCEFKSVDQTSLHSLPRDIPPQPLRPAPQSPSFSERKKSWEKPSVSQSVVDEKVIPIPRPVTKRQHSSPCSISHIDLSDVVAQIDGGSKSCTNPFLNGLLSITENVQFTTLDEDDKMQKNRFARRQPDDILFFSFPSNCNSVDESRTKNSNCENDELIELSDYGALSENSPTVLALNSRIYEQASDNAFSDQTTPNPFAAGLSISKIHLNSEQETYSNYFERISSPQSRQRACSNLNEDGLIRTTSRDSMSLTSSVVLADLGQQITGQLCIGLQYDKNTLTDEGIELVLTVMEAKELIGPLDNDKFDTFVQVYMLPDGDTTQQTKIFRNSRCPSYNETISFFVSSKKKVRRSLWFNVFHSGTVETLIGEAEFQIGDLPMMMRPITTWLTLSDSRHDSPYGDLLFSLSYLPTAERLTVVVVKARNLGDSITAQKNVFVNVYLLKDDKKVSKKKTSMKRADCSPIYNEALIFSVPPNMLPFIQIRLTVIVETDNSNSIPEFEQIGNVFVGCATSEKGSRHWNHMMTSLRKPVAMWHTIIKMTQASEHIE